MSTGIAPDLVTELRRGGVARRTFRRPAGLVGGALLVLLLLGALATASGVLPHDPAGQDTTARLQPPGTDHWFGTDQLGRDLFARSFSAVGSSLRIAVVATLIAGTLGTALGVGAGFFRRTTDVVVTGGANILFAFPPMLLALVLAAVLERSWWTVAVAISVVYIPIFVRTARGATLAVRELEFVRAAVSTGQHPLATMVRHVLPNIFSLVVMQLALALSWAVLTEAALSFLGLGTPPPAASLGSLIYDAKTTAVIAPWTLAAPGVLIILLVVAINLVGDSLRTALDPRENA
jgi:peptide/nickel transport system permease protein